VPSGPSGRYTIDVPLRLAVRTSRHSVVHKSARMAAEINGQIRK